MSRVRGLNGNAEQRHGSRDASHGSDEATRSCAAMERSVDGQTRLAVAAAVGTSAFRLHDQRLGFFHSRPVQPLHVAERGLLEAALAHPSATAHPLLAPVKDSAGVVCVRAGPSQPHSRSLLYRPQPVSGCLPGHTAGQRSVLFTKHLGVAPGTAQRCQGWPDPVTRRPRVVQRMFQSFCSLTALYATPAVWRMSCLSVVHNRSCNAPERQPRTIPPPKHVCSHLPHVVHLTVHGAVQCQQETTAASDVVGGGEQTPCLCCSGKAATRRSNQVRPRLARPPFCRCCGGSGLACWWWIGEPKCSPQRALLR